MQTYTYQSTNPLARSNPLRSIPFMRPASAVWHPATLPDEPAPVAAAPVNPVRELANAEAHLRECIRVYDAARAGIGEANRHTLPDTLPAFIRRQAGPFVPVRLSAERIRQRKSAAFSMFNKRRGELSRARRRVDAARAALGQPSLALTAARAAVASEVRASKRRPVVHHPIAQVALPV
jgi:hypothetical protein